MRRLALLVALLPLAACGSDVAVGAIKSKLTIEPSFVDAGQIPVNSAVQVELLLVNEGPEVQVNEVRVDNEEGGFFTAGEELPLVPKDGSEVVTLTYSPSVPGRHWANITVYSDAENGAQFAQAIGEALLPAARVYPDHIDLGRVRPSEVGEGQITVVNEGASDLEVSGLAFDDPRFSLVDATPIAIAPGEIIELTVAFAATNEEVASSVGTLSLGDFIVPVSVFVKANDCSTAAGALYDLDGDGYSWCNADCNDDDGLINPSILEVCDGVDQDCDELIDETTACYDDDGDGLSEDEGDCNDALSGVSPDLTEDYGNGIDDDCDGTTDYGDTDTDRDGFTGSAGDCEPENGDVHPGARETINGVDDDCNGLIDDTTTAFDDDGDCACEVGPCVGSAEASCTALTADDCDDGNSLVAPPLAELEDFVDNDCDGDVDEGTGRSDDDGDGYSELGGDCDDADPTRNPGEVDWPSDGIDQNCDGADGF
jgi:hypothetical protein